MSKPLFNPQRLKRAKATCKKKVAYEKMALAQKALIAIIAKKDDTDRLHTYRCSHCKKWHLGNKPIPHPKKLSATVLFDLIVVLSAKTGSVNLETLIDILRQREYNVNKIDLMLFFKYNKHHLTDVLDLVVEHQLGILWK